MTTNANRSKPTARELIATKQVKAPAAAPPSAKRPPAAEPQTTALAVADPRPYRERYLDEVAPASIVGRMIKFSKDGKFVTHDDGKEVPEDAEFERGPCTCLRPWPWRCRPASARGSVPSRTGRWRQAS